MREDELGQVLNRLTTEARNEASRGLDGLSAIDLARLMNDEDQAAVRAVAADEVVAAVAAAIDAVAARMARGGRLIYLGAGTSGRLGVLDAVECRPTFSVPDGVVIGVIAGGEAALTSAVEGAEDDPVAGAADLDALAPSVDDSVVGISASGRTPYVIGALRRAREVGALTVSLACNRDAEMAAWADVVMAPVVGPEVLSGSTRLKAGTATKLVLNMLSTGVMVRLGKCYDNLMVDLQATNAKLQARARRIVAQATGLPPERAATVLDACGGEVKTALLVALAGTEPAAARTALAAAGGRVRSALAALGGDGERGAR